MRDILESYTATELKKEISKYNHKVKIANYSKLKKDALIELMLKHKETFKHMTKKEPKARAAKPKPAPKPKAAAKAKPAAKPKPAPKPKPAAKAEQVKKNDLSLKQQFKEELNKSKVDIKTLNNDRKKIQSVIDKLNSIYAKLTNNEKFIKLKFNEKNEFVEIINDYLKPYIELYNKLVKEENKKSKEEYIKRREKEGTVQVIPRSVNTVLKTFGDDILKYVKKNNITVNDFKSFYDMIKKFERDILEKRGSFMSNGRKYYNYGVNLNSTNRLFNFGYNEKDKKQMKTINDTIKKFFFLTEKKEVKKDIKPEPKPKPAAKAEQVKKDIKPSNKITTLNINDKQRETLEGIYTMAMGSKRQVNTVKKIGLLNIDEIQYILASQKQADFYPTPAKCLLDEIGISENYTFLEGTSGMGNISQAIYDKLLNKYKVYANNTGNEWLKKSGRKIVSNELNKTLYNIQKKLIYEGIEKTNEDYFNLSTKYLNQFDIIFLNPPFSGYYNNKKDSNYYYKFLLETFRKYSKKKSRLLFISPKLHNDNLKKGEYFSNDDFIKNTDYKIFNRYLELKDNNKFNNNADKNNYIDELPIFFSEGYYLDTCSGFGGTSTKAYIYYFILNRYDYTNKGKNNEVNYTIPYKIQKN